MANYAKVESRMIDKKIAADEKAENARQREAQRETDEEVKELLHLERMGMAAIVLYDVPTKVLLKIQRRRELALSIGVACAVLGLLAIGIGVACAVLGLLEPNVFKLLLIWAFVALSPFIALAAADGEAVFDIIDEALHRVSSKVLSKTEVALALEARRTGLAEDVPMAYEVSCEVVE